MLTKYKQILLISAAVFTASFASADDAPMEDDESIQQTVVVTGTRRDGRTVAESPVPIDVLSPSDLTQGATDTNDILRTLVPSYNVQQISVGGGSPFIRPPTLRGLPPDQILVLVNGKRRHRSALVDLGGGGALAAGAHAVDIASIPSVAIGRVEVLRDGASAQYGSDAIAGVINFILKDAPEGGLVNVQMGQFYEGDGLSTRVQGNIGLPLSKQGFINISGEFTSDERTQRGVVPLPALQAFADLGAAWEDLNEEQTVWGNPRRQSMRLFVNGGLDLSDDDSLYFFGNYSDSFADNRFVYRAVGSGIYGQSTVDPSFDLRDIYPYGFVPRLSANVYDMSAAAGVTGDFLDKGAYDVSVGAGRNRLEYNIGHTINPSFGAASATSVYIGDLVQTETSVNTEVSYPFDVASFASPISVAVGAEFRHENYEIVAGEPAGWMQGPLTDLTVGTSGVPGHSIDDAGSWNRDSSSAYIDIETDLTDNWLINLAGRYDDFSDFGGTFNGKIATRYEILDGFALRSSVSSGFRAPTPGQSNTINTQTGFLGINPIIIKTQPASSPAAQYFGAEDLTPEESMNYTVGFSASLFDGLVLTVDAYKIEVNDRIAISGNQYLTDADKAALAALGVPGALTTDAVKFFTNTFDTETTGVDVVATYSRTLGDMGDVDFTLAYNHNETEVTKIDDPSIITRERKVGLEESIPADTAVFTTKYEKGPLRAMLRLNYYGEWTDASDFFGDSIFGPDLLTDVEMSYTFKESYTLTVGANNVFDVYPGEAPPFFRNFGIVYTSTSPYGYNGGYYYTRISAKF